MSIIEQIITFLLIYLLCYQIFLAHFHSKRIEGYELVLPKFDPKFSKTYAPVVKPTAGPVNNFLPTTTINMNFDPNSVITQLT
jgi:hypothetical protein